MATLAQITKLARKLEQVHGITIEVTERTASTPSEQPEVECYLVNTDWHFIANGSGFIYGQGDTRREACTELLYDLRAGVERKQ